MYTIASVQCETIIQNSLDYNNNNNNNKISIFRILYIEPAFVISFGLIIFVETLAPIDISFFFVVIVLLLLVDRYSGLSNSTLHILERWLSQFNTCPGRLYIIVKVWVARRRDQHFVSFYRRKMMTSELWSSWTSSARLRHSHFRFYSNAYIIRSTWCSFHHFAASIDTIRDYQ